ncbi:uncharacterized protein L201_002546 [Kwoniella dendrophila CBS 6074]|uniref:Aminoglycoside phosphotransferase domain-containing protein n=1 Tax=Kwoniella dendrophila CBS 6074 TaxID=1295534 RepID=A0AAX4JQH8_9TREE
MAFNPCYVPNCIYRALTWMPPCAECLSRYCFEHGKHPLHECWVRRRKGIRMGATLEGMNEPEVTQLLKLIDVDLIKDEVENLRPGHTVVKIDKKPNAMDNINAYFGQFNLQIKINFDDSTSWLMRIRRKAFIRPYPNEPLKVNLISEVATCQALSQAGIKVPDSILRPGNSKLHPNVIYCYQTFIEGKSWDEFSPRYKPVQSMRNPAPEEPLSEKSNQHIIHIARWFIDLEKVKFHKIGSLTLSSDSSGKIEVGPLIERQPTKTIPPYFDGPFSTLKARYLSSINTRLSALIARTLVDPSMEIKLYLSLLELRELVENDQDLEQDKGPFYIRHADDHWDHTRTKDKGEITGVIDWEWAYTTSKSEAFCSPMSFLPVEFHRGKNDIFALKEKSLIEAYQSLNRDDLIRYIKNGRKYQRLIHTLKCMSLNIMEFNATKRAFLGLPDPQGDNDENDKLPKTIVEWEVVMLEKWKDDEGLNYLLNNPVSVPELPEK